MLDDADQELLGDMMLSTRPVILGPNITGNISPMEGSFPSATGCFIASGSWKGGEGNGNYSYVNLVFNAEKSNSIYNKSTTVQPNTLVFNYVIKYQ